MKFVERIKSVRLNMKQRFGHNAHLKHQVPLALLSASLLLIAFQNCTPMAPVEETGTPKKTGTGAGVSRVPASGSSGIGAPSGSGGGVLVPGGSGSSGASMPSPSSGSMIGGSSGGSSGDSSGGFYGGSPSSSAGGVVTPGANPSSGGSGTIVPPSGEGPGSLEPNQPLAILFHPRDTTVEVGDSLLLAVAAYSGVSDRLTYQWYKNGAVVSGGTGTTLEIRNVAGGAQGSYHVVVSDGKTTVQSVAAQVRVRPGRNPCLAGWYGRIPSGRNSYGLTPTPGNEIIHESNYGSFQFYHLTKLEEQQDSYIVEVGGCLRPNTQWGYSGSTMLQCRNGKYVIISQQCAFDGGS